MKMKNKVLKWIESHRLFANIIAKFALTAMFLTMIYLFLFTNFIFVAISILTSTIIATATYLLWDDKVDLFEKIEEWEDKETDKNDK